MPEQPKIRAFRRAVSLLKKQGLLPSTVDARSAVRYWKVKGKYLSTLVKKYDDITSGKVTAMKVTPSRLKEFKQAGYETSQGRVLIPHTKSEKVVLSRGEVTIKSTNGIERVQIPVPYHKLEQYLRDIKASKNTLNRLKRDNEYFGFRFYGFNSSELVSSIDMAIETISRYESVVNAIKSQSRVKQADVYRNLEFVRVNRKAPWAFPSDRQKKQSAEANRKRAARYRAALHNKPEHIQDRVRQNKIERQRIYRANIKKDKKKISAYRKAALKRAHKSNKLAKKKGKKRQ